MNGGSRISTAFQSLRSRDQLAFLPFVTAADPDISTTVELLRLLRDAGADLIEVGLPYSDPIADGPVIQASYTRSLANKTPLFEIFAGLSALSGEPMPPLLAMVAYAIIFRSGPERFLEGAQKAGFSGLIVPDLPGDQAADLFALTKEQGLDLVQLVAPTTPPQRVERILRACSGFVYCISVAGTTGVRQALPDEIKRQLADLRSRTQLPLAVGFGIGSPEQIASLRGLADGVIVGSAIVRHMERLGSPQSRSAAMSDLSQLVGQLAAAAHAK